MGRAPLPCRPQESPLLNTFETADYLRVSVKYVRGTLRYEIPVVQYGKRHPLHFFRSDLDRWLAKQVQEPA